MNARIQILSEKKLVGYKMRMTLAENRTANLWQSFMPRRKEIINNLTNELISLQMFDEPLRLGDFNQEFEKWAVIEVSDFNSIPLEMEKFVLKSGLYVVFEYKGLNTNTAIFQYIYGTWLPASDYVLDDRPSFEILGEKYKNNDPESEEEIWVPIRPK